MRAREFIREDRQSQRKPGELPYSMDLANPGAITGVDMDRYYDMYRAGMLMGRAPATFEPVDAASWLNNRAYFGAYTEIDREKIKQAFRELGITPLDLVTPGSREADDVNIKSPVKSFRGYPR